MTEEEKAALAAALAAKGQPLPAGHPSALLMALRDKIPQVQADDSSTMSGIASRVGRTGTAIPRAALETMANWLRGTHDPNAVRIGEDTIAPLGLAGMAGLAGRGVSAAAMADNAKSSVPGTVVNAMGDPDIRAYLDKVQRKREHHDAKLQRAEEKKAAWAERRKDMPVDARPELPPVRAYHGTYADFDKFDNAFSQDFGHHFGSPEQAATRLAGTAWGNAEGAPRVLPVDLSMNNPIRMPDLAQWEAPELVRVLRKKGMIEAEGDQILSSANPRESIRQWLLDKGYDGVKYYNRSEGDGPSYIAIKPNTVRSATTGETLFADNATSSAPGLAASAQPQDDSAVYDILRRYGLIQ